MAYKIVEYGAGWQPISVISTTQQHPLGTEVRMSDADIGGGRCVYAKFPASTAVAAGLLLVQSTVITATSTPWLMIVCPTTTGTGAPLFVNLTAVASNAAVQYGWVAVVGIVPVLKTAVKPLFSSNLGISGTAGRVFISATSADQIIGARIEQSSITTTTSLVNILITRPSIGPSVTAA